MIEHAGGLFSLSQYIPRVVNRAQGLRLLPMTPDTELLFPWAKLALLPVPTLPWPPFLLPMLLTPVFWLPTLRSPVGLQQHGCSNGTDNTTAK